MKKLISFIKEFTREDVPELQEVERIGRNYFRIGLKLKEEKNRIKMDPFSAGLPYGEIKDNKFCPSFPLLDLLGNRTDQIAVVNDKAETMFLYGKNIIQESITSLKQDKGLVIVKNMRGDVLGYGHVKKDRDRSQMIRNILNRSDYLKRESRKPKAR
ncbi:hypothetical protein JW711_00020 [Candidatus Woesearchaeota archaeon]|nr:hypothetical protein [Candidatus Woesearchaeota archaeon]